MQHMNLEELRTHARMAIEEVRAAKDAFHAAADNLREKTEAAVVLEKLILEREIETLFDDAAPWRLKEFIPDVLPLVPPSPELSTIEGLEEIDVDALMHAPLSLTDQELLDAGLPVNTAFIAPDAQDRDSSF